MDAMEDMHEIVQCEFFKSLISAVKERMSMLRHQTRDFEAWRECLSKAAVPTKTLEQMEICTTECGENMGLLVTMLVDVERMACDFVSIHSRVCAHITEKIEEMHFYISRQQEMMNVASLGLLFPERDINVITVDISAVEARTADFYILYSLNKVDTFHNKLQAQRVAIQETHSSITNHFQSSGTDPSAMWLEAKIQFLDTHIAYCKDRAAGISGLLVEFHLNGKGQRIIAGDHWHVIESATHSARLEVIMWQHLYALFFSSVSTGYQNAMHIQGSTTNA